MRKAVTPKGAPNRSIKVVLIGNTNAGKTSLRSRFLFQRFNAAYKATIGADFVAKTLPLDPSDPDGAKATLCIWDTAGQERYAALGSSFYRGADAVILVIDSSDPDGLKDAERWVTSFREKTPIDDGEELRRFCWMCVATKCDLRKEGSSLSLTEAVGRLTEILGLPAAEIKPAPGAGEGPLQGDEPPAKPQDVLSRPTLDQPPPGPSADAKTPPNKDTLWNSFKGIGRRMSSSRAASNASQQAELRPKKSTHSLRPPGPSHADRQGEPSVSGPATPTNRSRLESSVSMMSTISIYQTPRNSIMLGSSPASRFQPRRTEAESPSKLSASVRESNRSFVATITQGPLLREEPATLPEPEIEENEDAQTISLGDHTHALAESDGLTERQDDSQSDMPPLLSGEPIPFPTQLDLTADTADVRASPSRRSRAVSNRKPRQKRVSRADTLLEVEPEHVSTDDASTEDEMEGTAAPSDIAMRPDLDEGFDLILTSSKTGENVDFVFQSLVQRVASRWRLEEWQEAEARRQWLSQHPDATPEEAAAVFERARLSAEGFVLDGSSMSVLQRDREAVRRAIRIADGKDPNRSTWRACCT